MNKYGEMAMRHWRETAPNRYSEIEDPVTFFEELGEQAQAQITDLQTTLAGSDLKDEEYLEKVGRLTAARSQAEEAVLADLVWIPPETTEDEAFEEWASTTSVESRIVQWADRWQEANEPDGLQETTQLETAAQLADELGLPKTLLLVARDAANPKSVLTAHAATMAAALRREWETLGKPSA